MVPIKWFLLDYGTNSFWDVLWGRLDFQAFLVAASAFDVYFHFFFLVGPT
jgi:hypothetical protein